MFNSFFALLIGIGIFTAFVVVLNLSPFAFFTTKVTALFVWMFSAFLPFRGLINLPSIGWFVTTLLTFELLFWGYEIGLKVLPFFLGHKPIERGDSRRVK